jgi:hypothetical protein
MMAAAATRPAIIIGSTSTTFGSLDVPAAANAWFRHHWAALLAVIGATVVLADRHNNNNKKAECCGIAGVVGNPKMHSDARYVWIASHRIGLDHRITSLDDIPTHPRIGRGWIVERT